MKNAAWVELEIGSPEAYVSVDRWGLDHWSTFAYLAYRSDNENGLLVNTQMRCNSRLHREFDHHNSSSPSRLRNGEMLENHDDWSCLEDIAAAGYIKAFFRQVKQSMVGNSEARVEFTPKGIKLAEQLTLFHDTGGKYSRFCDQLDWTKI